MSFTTQLILASAIVIVAGFFFIRWCNRREADLYDALNKVIDQLPSDFHNDNPSYVGKDETSVILLAVKAQSLCLIELSDKYETTHRIVRHTDLLEAEIVQDGHSVTKTSRTSQAANAIVGGVLLGGIGAVVGALTSNTSTKGKIRRIDLKLIVNDLDRPIFMLNFLRSETDEGGSIHKEAMKEAWEWIARIKVLINAADKEDAERKPVSA